MANIVQNKLTVLGPQEDIECLRGEIARDGSATGGYHDAPCLLYAIRGIQEADKVIEFETRWKPPGSFLREVSKRYPRLMFCLSFLEEDGWYGRLLFWQSRCVACEEYEGGDLSRALRAYRNHRVVVERGRKRIDRFSRA